MRYSLLEGSAHCCIATFAHLVTRILRGTHVRKALHKDSILGAIYLQTQGNKRCLIADTLLIAPHTYM